MEVCVEYIRQARQRGRGTQTRRQRVEKSQGFPAAYVRSAAYIRFAKSQLCPWQLETPQAPASLAGQAGSFDPARWAAGTLNFLAR